MQVPRQRRPSVFRQLVHFLVLSQKLYPLVRIGDVVPIVKDGERQRGIGRHGVCVLLVGQQALLDDALPVELQTEQGAERMSGMGERLRILIQLQVATLSKVPAELRRNRGQKG